MSNGTSRWARLSFFAGALLFPLAALAACSSDEEGTNGNGAAIAPDYVPVEASAQNPLPPGAGPRPDSGIVTPPPAPVDAGRDTSTPMDATVPPADTGASDGSVG